MSKMSDMAMTIEELRSSAAAINEAANWLAEQFGGTADSAPVEKPAAKKEKKTELKLEDVRAVLAEKCRAYRCYPYITSEVWCFQAICC